MRPSACVQVDLDGLWAVRRCYGLRGRPEEDDPVYSEALPALLDLFERLAIPATFFVVGADARVTWKQPYLRRIGACGHEVANHSMEHPLGLERLEAEALAREAAQAQEAIGAAAGVTPRGFRAPGFALTPGLPDALERLGFLYDASLLPAPWGWALRWVGRRLSTNGRGKGRQYGRARGMRAPLRPYHPDSQHPERPAVGGGTFWEVPVSVTPRVRLPFHGALGLLLGRRRVIRAMDALARREGFLCYVIHGMDLVDGRLWPVTARPGGRWVFAGERRERRAFFTRICQEIRQRFDPVRTDRFLLDAARKNVDGEKTAAR